MGQGNASCGNGSERVPQGGGGERVHEEEGQSDHAVYKRERGFEHEIESGERKLRQFEEKGKAGRHDNARGGGGLILEVEEECNGGEGIEQEKLYSMIEPLMQVRKCVVM